MIIKSILYPDFHHPFHDKKALNSVIKFTKSFNPDEIVIMGDAIDMACVNRWESAKENLRHFEGRRIKQEYEKFDEDILTPLEDSVSDKCKKVYLQGNHEMWIDVVIDKNPFLEGLLELEKVLELKERGWDWIPYITKKNNGENLRGEYKMGKLTCIHGEYTTQFHTAKTVNSYDGSIVTGHLHDIQSYTKVTQNKNKSDSIGMSIGCLCNKSPLYMKGKPNKWVTAFAVVYRDSVTGDFNIYPIIIKNGKFFFEGKLYQ